MLIDTHCHLNNPALEASFPEILVRARDADVRVFIVPAYDTPSLARTAELAESYPGEVFPAYGIHPWFVRPDSALDVLTPYIRNKNTIAIGEIGLDYSPECPPPEVQLPFFIRQLDMAAEANLPVLIHCRKAYDMLYRILNRYRGRISGILHSYSGGKEFMPRFMDLGFYMAFSGAVTRKNARKYHRTAAAMPMERLLLETDAPSIATESTVASEVEPRHIVEIAGKIAEIRALPFAEICDRTTENARQLFRKLR